MRENPYITIPEIMVEVNMSDYGVRRNINILKEMGKLERQGSNKKGKWIIKIDE